MAPTGRELPSACSPKQPLFLCGVASSYLMRQLPHDPDPGIQLPPLFDALPGQLWHYIPLTPSPRSLGGL
jgi:hypothetical protein